MSITVSVVRTPEALAQAFAIRAQVFIGEQHCPYDEEFDGNDFCATHFVAYVDGEPAGTIRVRWFHDFAKFERMSVLARFRTTNAVKHLMDAAFETVRRKGYTKVLGYAQKRLIKYWRRYGFAPLREDKPFNFSDHEYLEMVANLEPHPKAVGILTDPYIAMRPEGAWDEPGILERSVSRGATNPH